MSGSSQDQPFVSEDTLSGSRDVGQEPTKDGFDRGKRRRALIERASRAVERMKTTAPASVWSRLNAVDFLSSSMQFAAMAVFCLLPFLFLAAAITGGDIRRTIITRLGLDESAAREIDALIAPGNHALSSLGIVGVLFALSGALGVASTLQGWYQRVFDIPPRKSWRRRIANQSLWTGGMLGYIVLQVLIGRELGSTGARVPFYVVSFIVAVGFFWWTAHMLLMGRIDWQPLFPTALATAVCVSGLSVASSLFFSGMVVSNHKTYGPLGVVMVLLSYLVGLAVCVHLGAVVGRMWSERKPRAGIEP